MDSSEQNKPIRYYYSFGFDDGTEKEFEVYLHPQTLEILSGPVPNRPEWTRLGFHQCENCPLGENIDYCPVAVNLSTLVDAFKLNHSTDSTFVVVEAPERTYAKATTVQQGLSSIMGIYLVSSNCPILDRLRPMVRFHLPFANASESVFRSVTTYLLSQYFVMHNGGEPDWKLEKLNELYREVAKVNKGLWNRISNASKLDANVNALIILNSFGDALRRSLKTGLSELKNLFSEYLKAPKP